MLDLLLLRALAKSKHFSIRELERTCSFPAGTIKRWSRTVPGIDKVERVADVLGCSIDELCGRKPPENTQNDELILNFIEEMRQKPHEDLTDDEQLVLRKFRLLSGANKYSVLMLINKLESEEDVH